MTTSAADILEQLSHKNAPVLTLLADCRPSEAVWTQGPHLHRRFARLLLKQGHPTFALETAARGLERYPGDPDLLYCRALALVNSGNTTRGDQFVQAMLALKHLGTDALTDTQVRSDALALAGRIRKDIASRTADRDARTALFREASDFYRQAHERSNDTFPAINAATLALLAGEQGPSRALAAKVRDSVRADLAKPGNERDYWLLATLAEAHLLLGDEAAAKELYEQAVGLARDARSDGDIVSMRRQLLLLRETLPFCNDLLPLFHLGPVVVFAGHGLDWPGAPVRFPAAPALEAAVRAAIKTELEELKTNIGYCSPGCGSDLLFGELMRERNAELHLVLPFDEKDFISERLTYGLPQLERWAQRYEELHAVAGVTKHFAITENFLHDQVLYDFAGTFMQGLALTRATQMGVEAIALVVRDSTQAGSSGLETFIDNWRQTGNKVRVIELAALRAGVQLTTAPLPPPREPLLPLTPRRTVQAMLFADVAGFSGLAEPHLPAFFIKFLTEVEQGLKQTITRFENTWGDCVYLVFDGVVPCAELALRLLLRLESFDFVAHGFKLKEDKQPGVRIGLHTGPVFNAHDVIINRDNYFGSHVSRAARIEPVTTVGCAFVSEQFAAALALAPGHDFVCEFLGLQPLAKDYDICPLYRLARGAGPLLRAPLPPTPPKGGLDLRPRNRS